MKIALPSASLSLLLAGALAALTACGGGGGSASIGGTVTGLNTGLTLALQNNSADTFTIAGNGATSFTFRFATALSAGNAYSVTVLPPQPLGETCTVANGSGNVDSSGDSVGSVVVSCAVTSSVVASISGLANGAGVTLSLNGGSASLLQGNGVYAFPGILAAGSAYTVTTTQPAGGQTCTLTNATGSTIVNSTVNVLVTCS